jgi:hypothetical protein
MAVMARESWTDERLDDLKGQMIERFDRVDADMKDGFARVDKEMKEGFARVDGDIRELRGDIKEMQRLMIYGFVAIFTLMVTALGITAF